jgi:putative ABC transport system substrate-binding protein
MKRRAFLSGAVAVFAVTRITEAQHAGKVPEIGVVSGASPAPLHPVRGFREGLREVGYVEGHNVIVEYRWAHGQLEHIPHIVGALLASNVDVIVAGNTAAAVERQRPEAIFAAANTPRNALRYGHPDARAGGRNPGPPP